MFMSVESICFTVSDVQTRDAPSGIYNMGDDEALLINELIEVICSSCARRFISGGLLEGQMRGSARVGGWLYLPLDLESLCKLTEDYVSSNAKIKAALGVERMPVGAREGLRRMVESFK